MTFHRAYSFRYIHRNHDKLSLMFLTNLSLDSEVRQEHLFFTLPVSQKHLIK